MDELSLFDCVCDVPFVVELVAFVVSERNIGRFVLNVDL